MILIDCSTPNDLVSTIGQFTESLTLSAEELLKVCSSFYTTILLILKLFWKFKVGETFKLGFHLWVNVR